MRTVLKYEISLVEETVIKIPEGAKFLCAKLFEYYKCYLYMLIDWKQPRIERRFVIARVGSKHIPDNVDLIYLGSFFPENNDCDNYHVFEIKSLDFSVSA